MLERMQPLSLNQIIIRIMLVIQQENSDWKGKRCRAGRFALSRSRKTIEQRIPQKPQWKGDYFGCNSGNSHSTSDNLISL